MDSVKYLQIAKKINEILIKCSCSTNRLTSIIPIKSSLYDDVRKWLELSCCPLTGSFIRKINTTAIKPKSGVTRRAQRQLSNACAVFAPTIYLQIGDNKSNLNISNLNDLKNELSLYLPETRSNWYSKIKHGQHL